MRAESLQWRPPRWLEAFIATGAVTAVAKKSLKDAPGDDPRAALSGLMARVQPAAAALDGERSVAVASSGRSRTASSAADFSIATTALPSADIPHCNSASSHVWVEIVSHIPSPDTPGFVAVALAAGPVFLCLAVAFFVELADLDWGSWEGSLPESSSLGGDCAPLRGAFITGSVGIQELTAGKTLSALRDWRHLCRRQPLAARPLVVRRSGPFFRRRQHLQSPGSHLAKCSCQRPTWPQSPF